MPTGHGPFSARRSFATNEPHGKRTSTPQTSTLIAFAGARLMRARQTNARCRHRDGSVAPTLIRDFVRFGGIATNRAIPPR